MTYWNWYTEEKSLIGAYLNFNTILVVSVKLVI